LTDAIGHGTPDADAFHHWQAREITIDSDPSQSVIGDGELWGETPISIKVLPQAVKFVTPTTALE
jgi:diacylglycerol kinase family enzyme